MKKKIVIKKNILILLVLIFFMIISMIYFGTYIILRPQRKSIEVEEKFEVKICANDGIELVAQKYEFFLDSPKWVILVHPYRASGEMMKKYAKKYQTENYNVLIPDNRAHGRSGGKYMGMGYLDQYDLLCWINYLIENRADAQIVLHGLSMGASTIMMLTGQEDLPKNIVTVIEDSGYCSVREYLTWKLEKKYHLPKIPLINLLEIGFQLFAGYSMSDASAIEAMYNCRIPIMFIHGENDQTVHVNNVYKLYNATSSVKELYIVENAGHGECLKKAPEVYWEKVFAFITKVQADCNELIKEK